MRKKLVPQLAIRHRLRIGLSRGCGPRRDTLFLVSNVGFQRTDSLPYKSNRTLLAIGKIPTRFVRFLSVIVYHRTTTEGRLYANDVWPVVQVRGVLVSVIRMCPVPECRRQRIVDCRL